MSVKQLEDGSERDIDARSIVVLIVFFVVNALVIWPLRIPLPLFVSRIWHDTMGKLGTGVDHDPTEAAGLSSATRSTESENGVSPASGTADKATTSTNGVPAADSRDIAGTHVQGSAASPTTIDNRVNSKTKAKTQSPTHHKRLYFPLDLRTSPVIGVLLLLASTCIPGSVVRRGIVGSAGVRPYDIMTLFICFAYISVSLDATGLLRYLAFLVASRSTSHGGGRTLYNAFYIFFAIIGLFFGNDPLILSGTPFLAYFTDHASIAPPTAFLLTHFQVSNLVSALLVSSNPTNLVLTSAFGISFLSYSAWMALPTIAAVVVLYPILRYVIFNRHGLIPTTIHPPHLNPRDALLDPVGAAFGATVFIITVVVLVGLSAAHLLEGTEGVWTVTAPAAGLVLIRDLARDWSVTTSGKQGVVDKKSKPIQLQEKDDGAVEDARSPSGIPPSSQSANDSPRPLRRLTRRFPTTSLIISRLPFPLLPFAFAFFVLVEGLQHTGWIKVFGGWWTAWMAVGGVAGGIWLMGMLSVLGCNVFGTNIGATILLARVLQYWATTNTVSKRDLYGAVFALAVGSNIGAYSFVFSASLAGLLWRSILSQKGISISLGEFMRWNLWPMAITMIVGCLVVAGEVCVMYKD